MAILPDQQLFLKYLRSLADHIDWPLLTTHWRDLLQMVLFI